MNNSIVTLEDFELDESTLSESEREVLRVLSYIMGGKND